MVSVTKFDDEDDKPPRSAKGKSGNKESEHAAKKVKPSIVNDKVDKPEGKADRVSAAKNDVPVTLSLLIGERQESHESFFPSCSEMWCTSVYTSPAGGRSLPPCQEGHLSVGSLSNCSYSKEPCQRISRT